MNENQISFLYTFLQQEQQKQLQKVLPRVFTLNTLRW